MQKIKPPETINACQQAKSTQQPSTTRRPTDLGYLGKLTPEQRILAREWIGEFSGVILEPFWKELGTSFTRQALERETWMDMLEGCTTREIKAGWASYQLNGPKSRSGRLDKPFPGAIYSQIIAARPKPARRAEPKTASYDEKMANRVTAEQAAQIIQDVNANFEVEQ